MTQPPPTREENKPAPERAAARAVPGLVLVFTAGKPVLQPFAVPEAGVLGIGRGSDPIVLDDDLTSRAHAEIRWDGARLDVRDCGSRNGTFVDGDRIGQDSQPCPDDAVLRIGHTLALLTHDITPYCQAGVQIRSGMIIGPTLRRTMTRIERIGALSRTLHLSGASGSGKEMAARAFHAAGCQAGDPLEAPFVAVNCATIPETLAERLLFGSRRGAFSGAENSDGYIQSAHGGTLFLDEVAELDPAVQAKLLRVLETGEVLALGASQPRSVDVRLCSATHVDLRERVAGGGFRQDLYFRLARPAVVLPRLCQRREDIPFLLASKLAALSADLTPHALLVERCLLREWPGNVRELLGEVARAAYEAMADDRDQVLADDLSESAGIGFGQPTPPPSGDGPGQPSSDRPDDLDRARIEQALREQRGNVSATARALGLHRNQLRRLLDRLSIDRRDFE